MTKPLDGWYGKSTHSRALLLKIDDIIAASKMSMPSGPPGGDMGGMGGMGGMPPGMGDMPPM